MTLFQNLRKYCVVLKKYLALLVAVGLICLWLGICTIGSSQTSQTDAWVVLRLKDLGKKINRGKYLKKKLPT